MTKPTSKKRGPYVKKGKSLYWSYERKRVTPMEFISELENLMKDPLDNIANMDGDMYMSDYRKLCDAMWHLKNREQKPNG